MVSAEKGTLSIAEPENFASNADVYELKEEGNYFELFRDERVQLLEDAAAYLRDIIERYGPSVDVRLVAKKKRTDTPEAPFYTISQPFINLATMDFDDEPDNPGVSVELITNSLIKDIEDRFDDEYDLTANTESYEDTSDLPFKTLCLDARQIFRRTLWDISENQTELTVLSNRTYLPVPIVKSTIVSGDTRANTQFFTLSSVLSSANFMYYNNDRQKTLRFFFDVDIDIIGSAENGGFISIAMYRFQNGEDLLNQSYIDLKPNEGGNTVSVPNELGQKLEYKVIKADGDTAIEVILEEGDSLMMAFESNAPFPFATDVRINKFRIILEEDSTFRQTTTRVLTYGDFLAALARTQGYEFESELFGPGGKHEHLLIAHGTWIRNMPQILNPELEDERRVQSSASMKDAFEAGNVLLPLRYAERFGKFYVGEEREMHQNFISISIRDPFGKLQEVSNKESYVLGDNYYKSAEIGSETSGSNYGTVNNLQSISGKAIWTFPVKNDAKYEVLTKYRTGSEDVELCRQLQWEDYPDQDSEYDNEWFFIDAKPTDQPGCDYVVKKWDDFFDELPENVYSAETNYNWIFRPSNLLYNHSWKITPAIWNRNLEFVEFASSNCNSSLITKEFGMPAIKEDDPRRINTLQRPTIRLMGNTFETVLTDEVIEQLAGNKKGLIEYLYNGERRVGRLIRGSTAGSFEVVEAFQ